MRKLIYTFADGRTVDTYAEATQIAKTENVPFNAVVVPIEKTYEVGAGGLREKYKKYFAE